MLFRTIESARFAFRLAVESWGAPDDPAEWDGEGEPVLLINGFCGTSRMLRPLARFLRRSLQRPIFDVALGIGFGDIRDTATRVYRRLEEREISGCDVVGYSMGGLVAAYLVKCLDEGRRTRRVITLGTPFGGVPLISRFPALLAACCRPAAQMRTGSPFSISWSGSHLASALASCPSPAGTTRSCLRRSHAWKGPAAEIWWCPVSTTGA